MKKLLYIQIAEFIMNKIVSGELKANDKVKSVREMALELKVNPKTIQKSFDYLDEKMIFTIVVGEGRYVTDDKEVLTNLRNELIISEVEEFLNKMKIYNFSITETIDLIKDVNDKH